MGLVPAEETDSATSSPTGPSDEESQLLLPRSRTFPTKFTQSDTMIPNYGAVKGKRNVRYVSSPLATPPANRSSASPSPRVRPFRRRQTIAEADEIWNELEEDNPSTPNLSPYARRRSLGTPSRLYRPSSSSTVPNALESSGELPPLDVMNASTPSLGRSTTGRLYRDRRKRRSTLARAGDGAGGRSSGRSKLQQGPTGGWWKMKKWLGSMRKGKEPDDGADNNGDEGSSAV